MPIYAYRCSACGHAKDVLQKISDPLLTVCPACGQATFSKQVTAAGFQLKGSGWYVTDFRDGNKAAAPKPADAAAADKSAADKPAAPAAEGGAPAAAPAPSSAPAPAAEKTAAAPPPPPAPAASST
ncbi:MAG: zinc ribbon domain-containing protein [Rubrivivax sp.]|nr:zinc ribbon domain-containing protein [Rubrivivax sp.]